VPTSTPIAKRPAKTREQALAKHPSTPARHNGGNRAVANDAEPQRFDIHLNSDAIIRLAARHLLAEVGTVAVRIHPSDSVYEITPALLDAAEKGLNGFLITVDFPAGGKSELHAALVSAGCDDLVARRTVEHFVIERILPPERELFLDGRNGENILGSVIAAHLADVRLS